MDPIARALMSLYRLTGIKAFYAIADPIIKAQQSADRIKNEVNKKKREFETAKKDIKAAADQFKAS